MSYRHTMDTINQKRYELMKTREEIQALQANIEPEPVDDYTLKTLEGDVSLSALFGDKDTLFVIHNMGTRCPSCTQWADGFNGVLEHIEDRAAIVLSSPDSPAIQQEFAQSRGWRFNMVSVEGSSFAKDLGYWGPNKFLKTDSPWPGVSVLKKTDAGIVRVSDTSFGPGDEFNTVYALLELTPEGWDGWSPKFSY